MFLIIGFLTGLTAGFTVLTSQKFGAGKMDEMRQSVGNAGLLSIIISVIMTIVTLALPYGSRVDLTKYVPTREGFAFTGWYTDKACTEKYSAKKVNGTLNLYAKNWVNVTYKVTDTSYQKRHANKTYYLDKARTTKYTSDSQILPADEVKKYHYGDTVTFAEGKKLYYKRHSKVRTLKPNGVYGTSDASGERFASSELWANTTVYIDWNHASYYDGVYGK